MSEGTDLKKKLFNDKKVGWEGLTEEQKNEIISKAAVMSKTHHSGFLVLVHGQIVRITMPTSP